MNCREFENTAGLLLEGELEPEASAHLTACARCRQLVDELVAVECAARLLPAYEPSPRLWERLQAAAVHDHIWQPRAEREWFAGIVSPAPLRPAFAGLLAATVLVAAGLAAFSTREMPGTRAATVNLMEVAQAELVQEPSYAQRYNIHLQQVERRLLDQEQPADAELLHLASQPLEDLDHAIRETQLRLTNYPEDALARDELLRLYHQKVTVLQAMNGPTW